MQGKHLITELSSYLLTNDPLPPEVPGGLPLSLAPSAIYGYTSFYLFVSETLVYMVSLLLSCVWFFSLVDLSYVDLFIRPVKKTSEGRVKFLPPQ